ncbi:uncharacterized protein LOC131649355 [Vicia villosa]|uniref:uncharacterized protein LOC131649355 n=1 Tax=Vicia villosa TaxID=3911 RepID=UPI00273A937E|nr:uncharacterized protein LOC131649355 [Vicia villosa]
MKDEPDWLFTAIYASPQECLKKLLWDELKSLASNINVPWMVAGDFNDIAHISEKRGGVLAATNRCGLFRKRMNDCMLSDLESHGPKFTWRGPVFQGGQHIIEKLDRAMSNDLWRVQFPDVIVKVLVRVDFSDHHPILINLKEEYVDPIKKPFRFENAWLMHESYQAMLQSSWRKDQDVTLNHNNIQAGIESWKFETFD